jgi:serine/threonine protein kinase/tetratricopeptide (TPR) repeat protein
MIASSQLESIFFAALEKQSPAERRAFLDQACTDDAELRAQVERLLAAHSAAGSFLEFPAAELEATADSGPLVDGCGTMIGPYKLLEQIGEGGFGVVFLAEQSAPVRRRVALKVIKPGMDSRQVIARFEAERQALALMDHPNIAKVLDAGTTGAGPAFQPDTNDDKLSSQARKPDLRFGRPYFVMELVQGVPITEYCDQCNLTTRERLELFVTVCQAVQHAHQKGVIHRDIKPTNVLVAIQDGRPAPKIIDFGVAKAINQQLTEHTLMTAFAQIVGTPLYMSPEQAELSPLGVDTRSDIYSLGVLLYELLTGTTPFEKDRLQAASYDELRRIIREEEPPRPSARLSSLSLRERPGVRETANRATTIAEHRRTDPRRLVQTVRGELDWIVMKCLEKDRNRRYETPSSLARDVDRYLHDETVQACPPSTIYQFRKFFRRNKVAAAFVGLLLVGVIGLTISNVVIKWERDARTVALSRAETIASLLKEMLATANPERVKGANYSVREALDDFSAGLGDQLAGQPEVEAAIRTVIGKSYWQLGADPTAEIHLKKAVDLRRQLYGAGDERVAESLVDCAWSLFGQRHSDAETYVREALSIYRRQQSDPRATLRALWTLQNILNSQSRLGEAEQVANDALALARHTNNTDCAEVANILHDLADTKWLEGKYKEAEQWARQSVDMHRRRHGDRHPETGNGLWNLGRALRSQQEFDEAETVLREALAIFRERYSSEQNAVQTASHELMLVLEAKGDRAGLDLLAREAEQAIGPNSPAFWVRLAKLLLSSNLPSDAHKEEAHRLIRRAIKGFAQRAADSYTSDRRMKAALDLVELTKACADVPGFSDEVDELNRMVKAEFSELVAASPSPAASADAHYFFALIQLRLGDLAGYRATCKALVDLPNYDANVVTQSRPIWTACLAPNSLDDLSLPVKLGEKLVASIPLNERHFGLYVWGAALYRAGQYEQAAQRLEESIAAYPSGPERGVDTINYQQLLLAMVQWQLGQKDAARRLLAETLPAIDKELDSPSTSWNRRATLEILRREAETLIEPEEAHEAVENETQPATSPNNENLTPDTTKRGR